MLYVHCCYSCFPGCAVFAVLSPGMAAVKFKEYSLWCIYAKPRSIKPNKEYFILKKSTSPTVIVECGFLSNPAETLLLTDKNYQDDLAHAIYIGVTDYLAQSPSGHLQ